MNVLLIDVDSLYPNLALMKISAWHKSLGNHVFFEAPCNPAEVYISCVFTWNGAKARGVAKMYPDAAVYLGGSGVDLKKELPHDIEHTCPDYDLYKERGNLYQQLGKSIQGDGSIAVGFTSRGCIRECKPCLVPKKEGIIREASHITEFIHGKKRVRLLDNNFFAAPNWRETLAYIHLHDLEVCWDQGIDVRLVTEETAQLLAATKFRNRNFTFNQLYFAWDDPADEGTIRRGIELLVTAGIKTYSLACYMLVGFDTKFSDDLHRAEVLISYGIDPYVMVYNNKQAPILQKFKRWVNGRAYKKCDFGAYQEKLTQNEAACE